MAKLKIAHKDAAGNLYDQGQASGYGGQGGVPQSITTTGAKTILVAYNDSANVQVLDGYVIAQKGAGKFLVANSATATYSTTVLLVDQATANLKVANQGSISCYNTSNVAFNASRITTKHVYDFVGNKFPYKINTAATTAWANVASA